MNFDALEKAIRTRPEGAPTDLELDRLVTGQLDAEEAREVEARAQRFAESAARLEQLRQGHGPGVDERAILAAIRRKLDDKPPSFWSKIQSLWLVAPLAAAAAIGLAVLRGGDAGPEGVVPGSEMDAVRVKGGLKLEVVRQRGESAERTISGAVFHPGDNLRFIVSLPHAARITVVGVEQDGTLYTAWPMPGQDVDPELRPGPNQTLKGAVTLDDTPGRETLHLVSCPPGVVPACKSRGAAAAPACAEGCRSTAFELRKE